MLTVKNVSYSYDTIPILDNVSFVANPATITSIHGRNGSGKTTLFRCIQGTLEPQNGSIIWTNGGKPRLATVDQGYRETLLPWKSTLSNIAFPLTLQKVVKEEREQEVRQLLDHLTLSLPLEKRAGDLSGGQSQLVALLRALIYKPELLLLDEPLSAVDYETRVHLRECLPPLLRKRGVVTLLISHDPSDGEEMSDAQYNLTRA